MPVKFTFFGAMCVLVERSDGKKLLFDPYISGNPQTTVPLETFYDIDYLFVTHNAGDHFGDADVIMQNAPKAVLISGKDVNRHVQKLGKLPRERWYGTIYGDRRALDDQTVFHTVQAIHRSKESTDGVEASHPGLRVYCGGGARGHLLPCWGHLPVQRYANVPGTVPPQCDDGGDLPLQGALPAL